MQTALILLKKIRVIKVSSDFRKRLLVLLIFAAMMINGFGLSVSEAERAGKWSAALIAVAVGQNVIATVFSKCNKALTGLSNEINGYIKGLIFGADEKRGLSSNEKGRAQESGSKGNSGSAIVGEYRKTEGAKETAWLGWVGNLREIIRLYIENKILDGEKGWTLVLIFIMFIIGVIHRKIFCDISTSINSINFDNIINNY